MKPLFRLIATAALVVLTLGTATAAANHEEAGVEHEFADPAFEARWERLDRPVTEFGVDRTFWWGPGPYTDGMMEEYAQSPGGERLVQYFDKSRMEIIDPNGDPENLWYVTNGLLVVEMITGNMQVGDNEFVDREPANVPVVGDPDNPFGPTYATLAGRLDDAPLDEGELVTERIDREGNVTNEPALADYGIGVGTYVPETDHVVAAPFWEIMTANGTIYADGELTNGPIFLNPFYAVGFPITEPYWSTGVVAGVEQDVLLQCFERRCLTYTPGNEEGWQVEAGNVGQHYYRWRYGDGGEPQTEMVDVFFVAIGDNGQNGQLIGCQDSLIPNQMEIEATDDAATQIERALMALFGVEGQEVGEDGLYNALYQSNLTVDSVTVSGGVATVALSGDVLIGGACDEPRFVEQIRATVLATAGIDSATITVNGTPLDELFGGPGGETETVQIHLIALGDAGAGGTPVGCDDSLVPADVEIEATDDTATRVERALAALFGVEGEFYGESGLYNALYQSSLTVDSVTLDGTAATVAITGDVLVGGVCDEPRFIEQIRQTVLAIDGVDSATITINGTPLDEFFGPGEGTETAQIYFVAIGDAGQNGIPVGENDSLIAAPVEIDATEDLETRVRRTLDQLLAYDSETYTDDELGELYNALNASNLTITSVNVVSGLADIHLSGELTVGGVLDEPWVIEQIRQTVLNIEGIQVVNVFVDGEYLTGYFTEAAELSDGILATFDVEGELFQLWTTNADTIADILALQAGESEAGIPSGPILSGSGEANYNLPWSWHLDPQQTTMAEVTIEVCDGLPSYVEANLDEYVNTIGQYCPWGAELVHVEDLRPDDAS